MKKNLRPGQCFNRLRSTDRTWTNCPNDAQPGRKLCATCAPGRCEQHEAFEANNCPGCGTSAKLT